MSAKDPFEFDDDDVEHTIIGPRTGRPAPAPLPDDAPQSGPTRAPPAPPPAPDQTIIAKAAPQRVAANQEAAPATAWAPRQSALEPPQANNQNPLIEGSASLVVLANALRTATRPTDLARLRQTVIDELRQFQQIARAREATDEEIRYGHYALCALIDEVVLSTPWGSKSAWPKQSLVATFHNEVVSGDRLLEIAEALEARPNRSPNLLELVYLCISFGFEGRMRLDRQGANRLFQMRERIFNAIRQVRGPFERALSPHWRGVDAAYRAIGKETPLWAIIAALAGVALLFFTCLLIALSQQGDRALSPLNGLFRSGPASLNRTAEAPAQDSRLYLTILDILKPDIEAGRVGVSDEADAVKVRLKDRGLFASGSADLDDAYDETMDRVAQAIQLTVGATPVIGFTDNQRIRSLRFASNQELSEARAATVAAKLQARGVDIDRLKSQGLGESQPVAGNDTPEGRRSNRRVEVVIPKTYAAGTAP